MKTVAPATKSSSDLGAVLGFLTLRLWLAARAIVSGTEKFAGTATSDVAVTIDGAVNTYGLTASEGQKVYGLAHYHGVPEALFSKFQAEPFIPKFALDAYDMVLGPVLIILGIAVLLGIATRISLFAMGLLYTSLTLGLILLGQDAGIAWLGIHVLLIAAALFNTRHNRFEFSRRF